MDGVSRTSKIAVINICIPRLKLEVFRDINFVIGQFLNGNATKESTRQKIAELEKAIADIGGKVEEYEEALVRKLIERITVYDDYFTVEFKSGIEIDVQL